MTTRSDSAPPKPWSWLDLSDKRLILLAATLYANIILAVMGDVLFTGGRRALSMPGGGIDARFASLRAFTANALSQGDIPLWNPTIFAGMPHLGGFESALFYPPSLIFRLLPIAPAINVDVAVHLFIFGLFTFLWLRRHELHPLAAMYGGLAAMLSGAYFIQIKAGDLAVVEAYAWTPLALVAIHNLYRGRFAVGALGSTFALAMPILCGYPPATVHIALVSAPYAASLFAPSKFKPLIVRGAVCTVIAVPLLTAVQLLPGIETYSRSVRNAGDAPELQSAKALSPSDLTAVAGPWNEIPMNAGGAAPLFFGIATLIAATYGIAAGTGRLRLAAIVIALGLLNLAAFPNVQALGVLAPINRVLYESRLLAIPASLFFIAISCVGLDALLRRPQTADRMAVVAGVIAGALCIAAFALNYFAESSPLSFRVLLASGGIAIVAATMLSLVPVNPRFRYGLIALGVAELYVFAIVNRPTTDLAEYEHAPRLANDMRVFDMDWRNPRPGSDVASATGSASLPSRRYLALIAQTQWSTLPHEWNGPFEFSRYHPLTRMLRVGNAGSQGPSNDHETMGNVMSRFHLVSDYVVAKDREAAFAVINEPTFEPWRTVVLERQPNPRPRGEAPETRFSVTDETVNAFTLNASLERPSILLITDAYAPGWRAYGLPGSSQWQYDVMPANVALRAIPLGAGGHRIRIEYAPFTYTVGKWVSLSTAFALAAFALAAVVRARSKTRATA